LQPLCSKFCTLYTILGIIIKSWIENSHKGNEEQSGFTTRRSIVDHIYIIRQILEKCNMQQEDISLITYNLEKVRYQENYYGRHWERQMLTNQLYGFLEIYTEINNA
jgi:hypothetical protein